MAGALGEVEIDQLANVSALRSSRRALPDPGQRRPPQAAASLLLSPSPAPKGNRVCQSLGAVSASRAPSRRDSRPHRTSPRRGDHQHKALNLAVAQKISGRSISAASTVRLVISPRIPPSSPPCRHHVGTENCNSWRRMSDLAGKKQRFLSPPVPTWYPLRDLAVEVVGF